MKINGYGIRYKYLEVKPSKDIIGLIKEFGSDNMKNQLDHADSYFNDNGLETEWAEPNELFDILGSAEDIIIDAVKQTYGLCLKFGQDNTDRYLLFDFPWLKSDPGDSDIQTDIKGHYRCTLRLFFTDIMARIVFGPFEFGWYENVELPEPEKEEELPPMDEAFVGELPF